MAYATIPARADATEYRIVIRAKLKAVPENNDVIRARVEKIFNIYVQSTANAFKTAKVYWVTDAVDNNGIENFELIAYLIDSAADSLIRKNVPGQKIDTSSTGTTYTGGSKNLTEVYLKHVYHDEPELIANTIIHELMHNKLNQGDEMHSIDDMIMDSIGFAQEKLPRNKKLEPSKADKDAMGPALGKAVPQFLKL